jgi:hypothetical protein
MTVGALAEQRSSVVRGPAFTAASARSQREAPVIIAHRLYIRLKFTGVSVEPDATWSNMWRVRMGGRLSDMGNLTRARDAAIAWARSRGLGKGEIAAWHTRETAPERSPMRSLTSTLTDQHPDQFKPLCVERA